LQQIVLRDADCVQFFYTEVTRMSARPLGGIDRATVEALMAASGVRPGSQELDAVVRSLARIHSATASLLQSSSFDETGERFYRLLEDDAGAGSAA
jgi:hypothetical protein